MEALDLNAIDWSGLEGRIRAAMELHHLSHRRFAGAAGVSLPAVAKWLNGGRIAPQRWVSVANALHLSVPELLGTNVSYPAVPPKTDPEAAVLLRELAALSAEPFDRAVPDLMRVLQAAQKYVESQSPQGLPLHTVGDRPL